MANHLDESRYIHYACYPGFLFPNVRILCKVLLTCDKTIINPGISFIIILSNHYRINCMLSLMTVLIWAKSGCNFLKPG